MKLSNIYKFTFIILILPFLFLSCKGPDGKFKLPGGDARKTPADPAKRIEKNLQEGKGFRLNETIKRNRGGGVCYDLEEIQKISSFCREEKLATHLDGARLFNALVKTGVEPQNMGENFDSVSLCFSKGLGTPLGSVLIGTNDFIKKARRVRKVLGGGMRQVGMVAAAGIYALENNIDRLEIDHNHASVIAAALKKCSWIESVLDVETNIVVANLKSSYSNSSFIDKLTQKGVLAIPFGAGRIRMVTHLDISKNEIDEVVSAVGF